MDRSAYFQYADGSKFQGKKTEEVFKDIQSQNYWEHQESVSGPGSSMEQTAEIRKRLPELFQQLKIKTILDIPCGDFNWMRHIITSDLKYTGADIVKNLVYTNNSSYQSHNIHFENLDLLIDDLGKFDLIFCRDCLVHLSNVDIKKAINNIVKSGSTYLVTTSFPEEKKNKDIPTGGWRPLDFEKPPFNFPKAVLLINEKCTEGEGLFIDKSLGVWEIAKLKQIH